MVLDTAKESSHRLTEAAKVIISSSPSAPPTNSSSNMPPVVQAVEEVNQMLKDWRNGFLSNEAAVERMNEIRVKYGSLLPPFPVNYPLA